MAPYTIYHNPRCSKSRATLALLEQRGIEPEIVLYLENPPDAKQLAALLAKLEMPAAALVREGEAEYRASGLDAQSSEQAIIAAMARYPKLIERPVVVRGNRAVLGRPPENVLQLLD